MKKLVVLSIVPVLALVLLAGCVTGNKMTDEEQVMQQTKAFVADVLAVNADNILNYVSEDFSHREVPTKARLAEYIQEARDKGQIEELPEMIKDYDGQIDLAEAVVTMDKEKGTASVYPIDASASIGSVSAELIFKKDPDKVWRIVEVNIDGI